MVTIALVSETSGWGAFDRKIQHIDDRRNQVAYDMKVTGSRVAEIVKDNSFYHKERQRHVLHTIALRRRRRPGRLRLSLMSYPHDLFVVHKDRYSGIAVDRHGNLYIRRHFKSRDFDQLVFQWLPFDDIAGSTLETSILEREYLEVLERWLEDHPSQAESTN